METMHNNNGASYGLLQAHGETPEPAAAFFRRRRRRCATSTPTIAVLGILAACALSLAIYSGKGYELQKNLGFGFTSIGGGATRSAPVSSLPRSGMRVVQSARKPETMKAEAWRRRIDPWRCGSPRIQVKFGGPMVDPMGMGLGVGMGLSNLIDLLDEVTALSDTTDAIEARRKIREAYREEIEKIRGQRTDFSAKDKKRESKKCEPTSSQSNRKDISIDSPPGTQPIGQGFQIPQLSANEDDTSFTYTLDIQGMDPEDVKLSLQDNILIIEGTKMVQTDDGYYSSSFKRSFTLPQNADLETLKSREIEGGSLEFKADKIKKELGLREISIQRLPSESESRPDTTIPPVDDTVKDELEMPIADAADEDTQKSAVEELEHEEENAESTAPSSEMGFKDRKINSVQDLLGNDGDVDDINDAEANVDIKTQDGDAEANTDPKTQDGDDKPIGDTDPKA